MRALASLRHPLSVLFALQTVAFLNLVLRDGTPIGAMILPVLGAQGSRATDAVLMGTLAAGSLGLVSGRRWPAAVGGFVAATVMFVITVADALHGGHFGAWLAPAAHAVRWATPAVVAALALGVGESMGLRALRWAAAAVFVAHGIECLLGHPGFVDFLIRIPDRYVGLMVDETTASWLLTIIGAVDVLVGTALSLGAGVAVAGWMAFWGFATACVRLLYWGPAGWPEALVRIANGGIPLIIALHIARKPRS